MYSLPNYKMPAEMAVGNAGLGSVAKDRIHGVGPPQTLHFLILEFVDTDGVIEPFGSYFA